MKEIPEILTRQVFPPAGPSLPRLPTFRFFCPGNDRPGRLKHHFFQSTPSILPGNPVVQLIFFSLNIWIQMIDQNTNLH